MSNIAPWVRRQALGLLQQRGHAWLLQGPTGLGQFALALALVQAWLCEQPDAQGMACGSCPGCHGIAVHTHPDLMLLMPETEMLALGWPLDEKAQREIDDKKRKPSKEIRVEAMREAVEFAQRTSSRNRGKAVLIYPAERMNPITANALLKTLEEPGGDMRFALATEAAHLLLPTIRSRCMAHTMLWPQQEEGIAWLRAQGLPDDDAAVLLQAAGGRPDDALQLLHNKVHASQWQALPAAAQRADVTPFGQFTPTQTIDILQKICHDAMAVKAGATPRFFAPADLPAATQLPPWLSLSRWSQALQQDRRTSEHPYNPGLFLEDLLMRAGQALQARPRAPK